MEPLTTVAQLEALYGAPSSNALTKVAPRITPLYGQWIAASRFVVLATVGPTGTDTSPRGDDGPVVQIRDEHTLLLPDWQGNNRLDSLRNIIADARVSLMFMATGSTNVVRVNGTAVVSADADLTARFEQRGKHPKTVIVVTVAEVYYQCAKAILRANLWDPSMAPADLPTAGQFQSEQNAAFDGKTYDDGYAAYAAPRMW